MNDHFEDAVERMLEDVARIDRSLVAEARGVIAALPNRRVGAVSRARRRLARWSPGGGRLAFAGAAAIVVAVAGVSLLGPFQSRPISPNSPSPSVATPSDSPSASASAVPTPRATHTGPAYRETLPVLLTGEYVGFSGWSPDGSRYAIGENGADSAVTRFFDRSGAEVGSISGVGMFSFAWLDANSFVFVSNHGNGSGGVATFLGRVGSTDYTELGQYDMLVPGPAGSVALTLPFSGDPSLNEKHQYAVVSAKGIVSEPRDGDPVGWSRDGTMLAVFHATALAPAPSDVQPESLGWLEIVRATGERVASTQPLTFANPGSLAFSPDGARVAFGYDPAPLTGTAQIAVLEIRTGHVTIIPESGALTWASKDQLLLAYTSTDYGKTPSAIMSWSAATGRVTTYGRGDIVGASGLGTVIIGSDTTHVFTWTSTTAKPTRTGTFSLGYSLGFGGYIPDSAWSPDGSSLVLTVGDWNMGMAMDAVLFRP